MTSHPEATVSLVVPADPSFVRIVRLVVSSLAADLGFDFEEVEDLRIAADELISGVMNAAVPGSPVSVEMVAFGQVLRLDASAPVSTGQVTGLDPLATKIVSALVASFELVIDAQTVTARFESRSVGGDARGE